MDIRDIATIAGRIKTLRNRRDNAGRDEATILDVRIAELWELSKLLGCFYELQILSSGPQAPVPPTKKGS
jgi:hypothetical protein